MSGKVLVCSILLITVWVCSAVVGAQEPSPASAVAPAPAPAVTPAPAPAAVASEAVKVAQSGAPAGGSAEQQVTLWQMVRWGGVVLWVTMLLGFIALVMGIYFLVTVTPRREVPAAFMKRVMKQLRAGDLRGAYQMCDGRDELVAKVVRAGLKMSGHERFVIQDAMESEGERGIMNLWQRISYLNNIGVVAPLLGLLGTVWGMILAFSQIANDNAQVRGIAVARHVSQAMICTVGGLIVAIPALSVYYFLRGRVVKIIAEVEAQTSEVIELLTRGHES